MNLQMSFKDKEKLIKEFTDENDGNSMLDFLYASDEFWFNNSNIETIKRYILDKQQDEYVEIGYQSDGNSVEDIFISRITMMENEELKWVLKRLGRDNRYNRISE